MPWSAVASVAGSLISSEMQGDSAGEASQAQDQGSAAAIAEQRRQFDLTRSDTAPYRGAGNQAIKRLSHLLGLPNDPSAPIDYDSAEYRKIWNPISQKYGQSYGGGDFLSASPEYRNQAYAEAETAFRDSQLSAEPAEGYGDLNKKFTMADRDADPVYQSGLEFGLEQGTRAIENRARAGGINNSGATLKALARFANDYGTTKAEGSYNRYTMDQSNVFNKYAAVSGIGQTAVGQSNSAGMNMANNVSGALISQGNARGAASIAQGNAMSNAFGGAGNALQNYSMMNRLFPQSGNTGGYGGYTVPTGGSDGWGGYGGAYYDMGV